MGKRIPRCAIVSRVFHRQGRLQAAHGIGIREIETQAGYRPTEETIRVVIDENYIVADELFRLVNFPEEERPKDEIQTGVDVPVTPMMLYGLISMALGAVFMFAEIIHRRDQ